MIQRIERARIELWLIPALILSTLLLYWPALGVFFSHDDVVFLGRAAGLEPWPHPLHRGLSQWGYFTLGWHLFGPRPVPFHLVALALHTLNGYLLYRIGARLGLTPRAGTYAALLFVASPAAFTPLHWISGTQELLVTLCSLLSALTALRRGPRAQVCAIGFAAAALLCKENAALLLPALAIALPLPPRDRWILGAGGVALAAVLLPLAAIVGGDTPLAAPAYRYAFGQNLVWNAVTYSAWLADLLDYFPDRAPLPQPQLLLLGLLAPALLAAAALLRPRWRGPILHATVVAVALIVPALPLLEHSNYYYLYLPLAPLWLLAGAGLAGIPGAMRSIGVAAVVLLVALSAWRGEARRSERDGLLPADPTLRLARVLEISLESMSRDDPPPSGRVLVLTPAPRGRELGLVPLQQTLKQALGNGVALRLFYPQVSSVEIRRYLGNSEFWRESHIYLAQGIGELRYLGHGPEGRRAWEALRQRSQDPAERPR